MDRRAAGTRLPDSVRISRWHARCDIAIVLVSMRDVVGRSAGLGLAALVAACGLVTEVDGHVDVTGDRELGDVHMTVDDCRTSGGAVELTRLDAPVLRATPGNDLVGPGLAVVSGSRAVTFEPSSDDCRLLIVDVHPSAHPKDGAVYDGWVNVDCTLPGGGHLVADASFKNCK